MICLLTMNISFWRVVNVMAVLSLNINIGGMTTGITSSPVEASTGLNRRSVQNRDTRQTTGRADNSGETQIQNPPTQPRPPRVPVPERTPDPRTATRPVPTRTATPLPEVPYAPPNEYVPTAINVRNLIVEEVLQRNDQIYTRVFGELGELRGNFRIVPESGEALARQLPQGANPYVLLPEEFRVGDSYGDLERPLDLLRYKTDQFWNLLDYKGQYDAEVLESTGEGIPGQILPFDSVRVDTDLDTIEYEYPVWRPNDITGDRGATNNPFNVHHKELIELTANPSVFGSMENAVPCTEIPSSPFTLNAAPDMDAVADSVAAESPGEAAMNAQIPVGYDPESSFRSSVAGSTGQTSSPNQSPTRTATLRMRGAGFSSDGQTGGGFGSGGGY